MLKQPENSAIRKEVERDFACLESELAYHHPGILDLLRVYGDYEVAVRQADAYFAALNPSPRFSTSDSSN